MEQKRAVSFSFTELLYGVVIGTAITRIESLELSQRTVLLILSLLLVFDDYLLYHEDVIEIEGTGKNFVCLFIFDMLVLAAWYAMVISTNYPMHVYLTCVAIFFTTASIWEWLFSTGSFWQRCFWEGDLPLVFTAIILAAISFLYPWPFWVNLITFCGVFVFWRIPSWKKVWGSK